MMRHVLFSALLLTIVSTTGLALDAKNQGVPKTPEQLGFQDIPFGTSKDEMKKLLKDKFGSSATTIYEYDWVSNFKLGDKPVTITFYYDHNNNFYKFSFKTERYSANNLDAIVRKDGEYLSEVFTAKYGRPVKCFKPGFFEIRQGYVTYLCKWNNKDLEIYTGLATHEFEYYATAAVTSKKMNAEFMKHTNKREGSSASKGAGAF